MSGTAPSYEYRVLGSGSEWRVFVVHDRTPEWWRLIATFADQNRAESYAGIENEFKDDEDYSRDQPDIAPPPVDLPALPASRIVPENFAKTPAAPPLLPATGGGNHLPPETDDRITAQLASGHSVRDVMANSHIAKGTVQKRRDALVAIGALPSRAKAPSIASGRRGKTAVTPEEMERRVAAALAAITALDAADEKISYVTVAEKAGMPTGSVAPAILTLKERGIIAVVGHRNGADASELRSRGGIRLVKDSVPQLPAPEAREEPKRRFTEHHEAKPEFVSGLPANHPALVEARTLFPTTVVNPADSPRLLVSGANSRKIGDRVTKGAWAGMPIFTLSLEERATCPETCHHWATCYGNGMPMARRHKHGPDLITKLQRELAVMNAQHPTGFVVRLHVLGDFYSLDYVAAWGKWLDDFPALRVFGYTAWQTDTPIGKKIAAMRAGSWDRFAVRTSSETSSPYGATTIWRKPEEAKVLEGIVCPAQTDKTACCGSCGLCWAGAARSETIVFIAHGRTVGAKAQESFAEAPPAAVAVANKPQWRPSRAPADSPAQGNAESVEEFLARGGQIKTVPAAVRPHQKSTITPVGYGVHPAPVRS